MEQRRISEWKFVKSFRSRSSVNDRWQRKDVPYFVKSWRVIELSSFSVAAACIRGVVTSCWSVTDSARNNGHHRRAVFMSNISPEHYVCVSFPTYMYSTSSRNITGVIKSRKTRQTGGMRSTNIYQWKFLNRISYLEGSADWQIILE